MAGKQRTRSRKLSSIRRRRSRGLFYPAELLDEILVRLPIKSIIRFESVSKAWRSNFRSTLFKEFCEQHNNHHKPEVVHTMKLKDLYKMVPTLEQQYKVSTMVPLSNGIYCLTFVHANTGSGVYHMGVVLCNPAICQFNLLPPLPPLFQIKSMYITSKCQLVCGFGIVPGYLDYRVVVIVNYRSFLGCFLVFVYSSSSGEWEKLVDYIPEKKTVGPSSAITRGEIENIVTPNEVCSQRLLKGCWHWMTQQYEKPFFRGYYMVLSFDFAHQSFELINGPPMGYVEDDDGMLDADVVVLHDKHLYFDDCVIDLSVWMMMDYGVKESWTRIFYVHSSYEGDLNSLYRIDYSVDAKEEGGSDNGFVRLQETGV